jgi:hypothetical protein
MSFKILTLTSAVLIALTGCGDGTIANADKETPPVVVVTPEPEVEVDFTSAEETALKLGVVKTHINTVGGQGLSYYVDLAEDAETLVVSLFSGTDNKDLGDPDVYVKFEEAASAGENGVYDCVSYNGNGYNENCIIDKPKAGRYHIFIDAYEGGDAIDASMFATTELFSTNILCDEPVRIRAQDMTIEQLEEACAVVSRTKEAFDNVLSPEIVPEFQQPVENDLNDVTNIHIFASLSNHASWAEHLYDTSNTSGIYFETSPTEWWHSSDIWTFNALEWSGGRSVIRSFAHEYIHALDGRYNKEGGYNGNLGWWSEGLAEYLSTFYQKPFTRVTTANSEVTYTLAEIFAGDANIYTWGQLAVAFLIESHPELVNQILVHMRAGEWDELNGLLANIATDNQNEFETWSTTNLKEQYNDSAESLTLGDYNQINGRGGWLYSVEVPEGLESVTFATNGGSGNVDFWVKKDTAVHPAIDTEFICQAVTENNNEETCTLTAPESGTYYVAISSDFIGSDIIDLYFSACGGSDCTVMLPEQMALVEATEPYLPHWPEKGTIGTCSLAETYYDSTKAALDLSITNPTDKLINIYWLSRNSGDKAGNSYATLAQGETYTADDWDIGHRIMLTDGADNCLGVALLNDENNAFEVTDAMVENAIDEAPAVEIPEATAEMGSCDLAVPYTRGSGNAPDLQVANTMTSPVKLYWINNDTGEPLLTSVYATLAEGEIYTETFWAVGDRMMVTDESDSCIGVLDLNDTSNIFVL